MKKLLSLILLLGLMGCQEEQLTVVENQQEESLALDSQLVGLMKSVSSHDGSHDNVVDRSSCFSIDFPYVCNIDGVTYTVNSASDLKPFTVYDVLTPEFPVTITYLDHSKEVIENMETYQARIEQCEQGDLNNDAITCVDFNYPVTLALYHSDTASFETIVLNHDLDTFSTLEIFAEDTVANIEYPIVIYFQNGFSLEINSNNELKLEIIRYLNSCN